MENILIKKETINDIKAVALKSIGQNSTEDTPAFEMAEKNQILLITKVLNVNDFFFQCGYRYVCQDTEKKYGEFYVKENEIKIMTNNKEVNDGS